MSGEPEVDAEEIARVLRLYEGPPRPRAGGRAGAGRGLRRPILATSALVIALVSIAAVIGVVTGSGRERTHAAIAPTGCTSTLVFGGTRYVGRTVPAGQVRLGRSLGGGVLRPCGGTAQAASATALAGIDVRRAVGARGQIYVAPQCADVPAARLLRCVRAAP